MATSVIAMATTATRAIGDQGVAFVLDAIESLGAAARRAAHRIEHIETIPDGTEDFVHSNAVLERPGAVVPLFERGLHLVASTGSIGIVADEEHVQVSVFPAHDILDDVV